MLARLRAILKQSVVIGPWVLILIVASLALITPSTLQGMLTDIADASLVSRLGLIAIIYGALGFALYRRYPQHVERVLPKRTKSSAPPEQVSTETVSKSSTLNRATSLFNRSEKPAEPVKVETVMKTERAPQVSSNKQAETSTSDMSEDDFYAFLESVSDDEQKGSG